VSEPVFRVEGLRVDVNIRGSRIVVIDGVSFSIAPGESLALVGESGSGKSLIAMGAVDLLPRGAGVVGGRTFLDGTALHDLADADWRRLVGMGIGVLFQDAVGSWDPMEILGTQSGEGLETHTGMSDEEIRTRVLDALGEVQLPRRLKYLSFAHQVSRGQAQRAMLASALLAAPRILIADEPLSGLDVTVARAVLDLIDDLRRRRGMGLLLVTHDLGMVASVADRVAVVYGGMLVEVAGTEALYRHPKHPYTDGLLGSVPGLTRGRLRPIEGDAPELWELPEGCPFAPRCPHAVDRCRRERPEARPVDGTLVACHLAEDLDLPGIRGEHRGNDPSGSG
jgi:oligopeptide/dipeptide ABC transporter ATP-binding protein